jgi:glycerol-1-phosphate dehydrogenase [NAD(P)+]
MPIFGSNVSLPILVRIEGNLLDRVNELLRESNLLFTKPLIVTMKEIRSMADEVSAGFKESHIHEIADNSYLQVEAVEAAIDEISPDVLLGVGGGRVIDVAKFAGSRRMLSVVSVPTSLSNDGISSPVAVIRFRKGTRSVGVNMPTAVLVDPEAITSAPKRNLKAGVGDLLSNISATNDWLIAYRKTKEHYDTVAALLARKSAFEMLDTKLVNFTDTSFLRLLAEGLLLSGIAMGIAGTSRPSSGAEHLLSHAYDALYPDASTLHGEQVAMFAVFTSYLQDEPSAPAQAQFLKANGLIASPADLGLGFKDFKKLLDLAPSTRPGRTTVLDEVGEADIQKAYNKAYK